MPIIIPFSCSLLIFPARQQIDRTFHLHMYSPSLYLVWFILLTLLLPQSVRSQTESTAPSAPVMSKEEVKRPAPFSEQEVRIIQNASTLPLSRLVELMMIYEKLENEPMLQILVRQILKRDPKNTEALRISGTLDPNEEIRPADYLERLSKNLHSGRKVEDPEGVVTLARSFIEEGRPALAVELLESLHVSNYAQGDFPFLSDLAEAYQSNEQFDKAEAAWKKVQSASGSSLEDQDDARAALGDISLQREITAARSEAARNPASGLSSSAALLSKYPADQQVIGWRIEALILAGQAREAIAFIEAQKGKPGASKTEDYRGDLADAYLQLKDYGRARGLYEAVLNDKNATPAQRASAEQMIAEIRFQQTIGSGYAALEAGRFSEAQEILTRLEEQYPKGHEEITRYRSVVMVKTGRKDEALELLLLERIKASRERRLFTLMDALAAVYLERDEFTLAKVAYEDIIANPGYSAEDKAEAEAGLKLVKREKLFGQIDIALSQGDLDQARERLDELENLYPNDRDVLLVKADLALAENKPQQALNIYTTLKEGRSGLLSFDGQSGMVDALKQLGRWEESVAAADEILANPAYGAAAQAEARWDRRQLLPWIKHHAVLDVEFYDEAGGQAFRQSASYSSPWWNGWRLLVEQRVDFVTLEKDTHFIAADDVTRMEAEVKLQRRFDNGWFAEVGVGGAEDNVLYSARIGKFETSALYWSLGWVGNARSTRSLPLEVLNGRENRLEFKIAGQLHPRVNFDVNAYTNWLHVDGDELGHGYGFYANMNYIIMQETSTRPEVSIGWVGEYSRFKSRDSVPGSVLRQINAQALEVQPALARTDDVRRALPASLDLRKALPGNYGREIFDSLIDPEINRQGVQLTISKRVNDRLSVYAQGGPYYDVDDESVEFTVSAGVQYWISDDAMLYAEIRYDSDGRGSGAGSGTVEGRLGAEVNF